MSIIGVIVVVIVFIFYVARSVEKQNAQEQKRRERMRGNRRVPDRGQISSTESRSTQTAAEDQNISDISPAQTAHESSVTSSYQKALQQAGKTSPSARPFVTAMQQEQLEADHGTRWLHDRQAVRRAFIFSECIGKPRSLNPHPYFNKRR